MHPKLLILVLYVLISTIGSNKAAHRTLTKRGTQMHDIYSKYGSYSAMMSMYSDDSSDSKEGYSDREQLVALILSIFLGGIGGARWYIGDYAMGLLLTFLFVMLLICVLVSFLCPDGMRGISFTIFCIAFLIWLGLVLADIIRFAMNDIKDQDGYTLYPM